jgi:hypothetical protein
VLASEARRTAVVTAAPITMGQWHTDPVLPSRNSRVDASAISARGVNGSYDCTSADKGFVNEAESRGMQRSEGDVCKPRANCFFQRVVISPYEVVLRMPDWASRTGACSLTDASCEPGVLGPVTNARMDDSLDSLHCGGFVFAEESGRDSTVDETDFEPASR